MQVHFTRKMMPIYFYVDFLFLLTDLAENCMHIILWLQEKQ